MSSTLFRVLPVRWGDACLLSSARGIYLFDGGSLDGDLDRLLRERRVGKIRAVVCTAGTPGRLGGVIDLMDGGYPVSEFWLPEGVRGLLDAASRFDGGFPDWFLRCAWPVPVEASFPVPRTMRPVHGTGVLAGAAVMALLSAAACTGRLPERPRPMTPGGAFVAVAELLAGRALGRGGRVLGAMVLDVLDRGAGRELAEPDLAVLCARLLAREAEALPVAVNRVRRAVARTLAPLVAVGGLLARGGFRVRWFRPTGELEQRLVPRHPIRCLNGVPDPQPGAADEGVTAGALFQAARRLDSPEAGLVFNYGNAGCGALLCGASSLSFLGRRGVLPLTRPTVITAPHQGGLGGEGAYARIAQGDPSANVWVRTHCSHARKVAEPFRRQPSRYCLHNCRDRTVQEILLAFERGRWRRLSGGVCTCF